MVVCRAPGRKAGQALECRQCGRVRPVKSPQKFRRCLRQSLYLVKLAVDNAKTIGGSIDSLLGRLKQSLVVDHGHSCLRTCTPNSPPLYIASRFGRQRCLLDSKTSRRAAVDSDCLLLHARNVLPAFRNGQSREVVGELSTAQCTRCSLQRHSFVTTVTMIERPSDGLAQTARVKSECWTSISRAVSLFLFSNLCRIRT